MVDSGLERLFFLRRTSKAALTPMRRRFKLLCIELCCNGEIKKIKKNLFAKGGNTNAEKKRHLGTAQAATKMGEMKVWWNPLNVNWLGPTKSPLPYNGSGRSSLMLKAQSATRGILQGKPDEAVSNPK